MVGENSGGVTVDFGLPDHFHAGPFRGQVEASDPGEQRTDT
jgi:hypothetical protein